MTRVTFYSNVVDKQLILFDLVQAAIKKQHSVTVLSENKLVASAISKGLWETEKANFIPNVLASHPQVAQTAVVIGWEQKELSQDDILINLIQAQPMLFSRFRQLIEIVGHDDEDKAAGRQRFKFYRDRGYEIKHIDALTLKS